MADRTGSQFPGTSWTLIRNAGPAGCGSGELARFLELYRSPIYAFLRHKGLEPEDADDGTQEFIRSRILEKGLLERADPNRRFRTFLMACLERFWIDEFVRKRGREDRHLRRMAADRGECGWMRHRADDPETTFRREYATAVVEQAVRRLEDECRQRGMDAHWRIFEGRTLNPVRFGTEKTAVRTLMDELGIDSAQKISDKLRAAERWFNRHLRTVVADTVADSKEIESELAELLDCLAAT